MDAAASAEMYSQCLLLHGVDALAPGLYGDNFFVQLRANSQIELASKLPPGLNARLFATVESKLQRMLEFGLQVTGVIPEAASITIESENFYAEKDSICGMPSPPGR